MTRLVCRAALPAAVALAGSTAATPGEMFPIDIVLRADTSVLCVNYSDLGGDAWFIAEIADIHPDLPPLPFEEGFEFRVTGQYCLTCVQTFCGSFEGFIFAANLLPVVPGDVNADGATDVMDFLTLLGNWGPCPASGPCAADLDGDSAVGVTDMLLILANWS